MTVPTPQAIVAIRAWYRLDRAFASVNRWLQHTYHVTGEQIGIARIVAEHDVWSLAELRDRLSMHPATLGQSLARLEARGFVQIDHDQADKRRRLIRLTSAGRDLLAALPVVGPVRLRTATADPAELDALAAAFNQAVDLFGLQLWADDPNLIDTKEKLL